MAVDTKWLDQAHTTIIREFSGRWTWDEFDASQQLVIQMLNSVTYNVHQIMDFSASTGLPPDTLGHLRTSGQSMPANRGKSIVVMSNTFYKQAYYVVNTIFPGVTKNVMIVSSRQEALDKLDEIEGS